MNTCRVAAAACFLLPGNAIRELVAAHHEAPGLREPDLPARRGAQQRARARGREAVRVDVVVQAPDHAVVAGVAPEHPHPRDHRRRVEHVAADDVAAEAVVRACCCRSARRARPCGTSARRSGWPRSRSGSRAPTGSACGSAGTLRERLHRRARAGARCASCCGRGRSRAAPSRPRHGRGPCSRRARHAASRRDSESHAVITRTYLIPSRLKYGLENISGLCSPMPILGIGAGLRRRRPARRRERRAARAAQASSAAHAQDSVRTVSSWE